MGLLPLSIGPIINSSPLMEQQEHPSSVNRRKTLMDLMDVFQGLLGEKSGKIKTNVPLPLSFHCYCDKHKLNSVKCLNISLVKESKEGTEQIIF